MRRKLMQAVFPLIALGIILSSLGIGSLQSHAKAVAASSVTFTEFPVPTANSGPSPMTVGPDRNIWFTEYNQNKIGRITPGGSITEFPLPSIKNGMDGITAGSDGNLWFTQAGDNEIGRITPGGSITEFPIPSSDSFPQGITSGPDGNLWFTEWQGNKIGRITPSGSITEFPIPTSGSEPWTIASGPDGNLWFTEWQGNKIGRITPSGSITEFPVPTGGSAPQGITTGPDGNLWFAEFHGNKIGRVNLRTTPTGKWLQPADNFNVTEGEKISLTVQADPGQGGAPIKQVNVNAWWPGVNPNKWITVCTITSPKSGTTDQYGCNWNFVHNGKYIPSGSVQFSFDVTDTAGNTAYRPDGVRQGTFTWYTPTVSQVTSQNWGGYVAYGSSTKTYNDAKATWTVTPISCGANESSEELTWVGLGGIDNKTTLEQIGTASQCSNGQPYYYTWWEVLPQYPQLQPLVYVPVGAIINPEVHYKGNGVYHLFISSKVNGTTTTLFSKDEQGAYGIYARNGADFIAERPLDSNGNLVPLVHYQPFTFSNCSVDGKPISYGPIEQVYTMTNDQFTPLEQASSLNGTHNGFTVTWLQSS